MFTGLIQDIGTIKRVSTRGNYRVLRVQYGFAGDTLQIGESISCDGACLTVTEYDDNSFTVEASQETASRTIIEGYRVGSMVNLERALKTGDRLGGHIVSGHVDDIGVVDHVRTVGESLELGFKFDYAYDSLVIEKGSVAVNGVSLTVNGVKPGWLSVNIIPHTVRSTTLGSLKKSDRVNLEFDMLGKYIAKLMTRDQAKGLTKDKLRESGW